MGGAAMAEHGALAARQYGGEIGALAGQAPVADGKDTAMEPMQAPVAHTPSHRASIDPERPELRERHDTPLRSGQLRERDIARVLFCMHAMRNRAHPARVARRV